MAYDPALAARVRKAIADRAPFEELRMFGGLCWMVGGHMTVGLLKDELMVKGDPARHDEVLARPHVREMDFTKRPMRGMVFVTPEGTERDGDLEAWIVEALAYARSLPPKARAPKARKTAR